FNLNPKQLTELYHFFPQRYDVQIIPYSDASLALPPFSIQQVFDILVTRASFGDALIVALIKKYLPKLSFFVSWDADHFKNKVTASVLTPLDFLKLGKK